MITGTFEASADEKANELGQTFWKGIDQFWQADSARFEASTRRKGGEAAGPNRDLAPEVINRYLQFRKVEPPHPH